ncbi:uncharacterized protein [Amphiura filiformis]|uniref:uncharacterized protein n=1 Tax=Amphiura filiformis TaxID=82378 RepID=UPI003B21764E
MTTSVDLEEFHYYVQCHEAIQVVCDQAVLPCAENVIKDWHTTRQIILHCVSNQNVITLQPCLRPTQCSTRITDNKRRRQSDDCPVYPPLCKKCSQWCHAIETLFWTNGYPKKDARVTWRNINPSRLFHDYVEVAKAFAVSLPPGQSSTCFGDFDPASILKVMMKFGECHLNNLANHDVINKVYQVRNNLCHKRIADNLEVTKPTRNGYFDDIFNLVELLEKIHPQYFTTAQADDIRDKLQNIQTLAVTHEMEERATRPLTAEMKQWMQQVVKDSEDELQKVMQKERKVLQDTMSDCTDAQTRRLQDTIGEETRHQTTTLQDTYRDQTRHQTDILTSQIDTIREQVTDCTEGQTRSLQDTIRGQTRHQTTTLQDTYRDQTRQQMDKLTNQIDTIREQVTDCTEGQTRRLQDTIRGQTRHQTTTLQDTYRDQTGQQMDKLTNKIDKGHLRAEEKAQERQKELQKELEELPARIAETREKENNKYLEDIKQQLSSKYTRQYSSMRFTPKDKNPRTTDSSFVAPELNVTNEEPGNLSCDELFSLKIRNDNKKHTIVVGSPGSGKSTLIHNRIAYDWGRGVKHQQIKLLFVIDMCKVKSGSDMFEILKDQLLRGAQREKLEKLIEDNAQSTAFLLDGFDEISQGWDEDEGKNLSSVLDGKWLSGSHVIVTTRPERLNDFCELYIGYTQVELLGFSDEAISEFITKQVGKSSIEAKKWLQKGIDNLPPVLTWMPKNPLTLTMLCILWQDHDCIQDHAPLTKGVTSLYQNVIKVMKLRCALKSNIQNVLKSVGKFALQDLCGQEVIASEVPEDDLQVSRRIGICSTKNELVEFEEREFLTFPMHRSFQEFCAATYLADIADSNQDQFISAIAPVVDNKSLLQFCCGLSLTAASTILQQIVSTTAINVESEDTCIFGVGPRVANPWKLPLLLLFEAESQMSVDSAQTSAQLHVHLSPLVKSIQMNHGNWPADNEMCHLLQYFISKKDDKSWLSQVKFAVIVFCTKIDVGPSLAQEQTNLIECLSNLSRLKLCSSTSILQSQVACTHILRYLRLAKYVENESSMQQCQSIEVIFSNFDVSELDFLKFLCNQIVPLSVKLNTVTLVEETDQTKSHITINSLNELIVCDSKCKGQSLGTVLSRILSRAHTQKLSLIWTSLTKTHTGIPVEESDVAHDRAKSSVPPSMRPPSVRKTIRRSVSVSYPDRIDQFDSEFCSPQLLPSPSKKRKAAARNRQEIQRQALDFFSSCPLTKSILTNLVLAGCALTLQALTNMLKSQHDLSEITLQSVYLFGNVPEKCVNENVKKCILKSVIFFDNFANFIQQFPEVTDYHMSDIYLRDEIVEGIVTLPSLQNVTISRCTLGSNVNVLLRGPTPKLQHLDLASNSIGSDGASALAQSFQHTPALQHLDLASNSIGSDGASALAQSFQRTPALQHLDLANNSIGSDGASALAQSFQHTPALQHLDLASNSIGSDGASALAQSFQHTPELQHLDLARNSIGSDGASALARSFQHTPALQHFNLARNSIGSDGASALESFQHTPELQHLNLASNIIGSDGASALVQSFQHTPELQHLDLADNSIGSDGASALAKSFTHLSELKCLNISYNKSISPQGVEDLFRNLIHLPLLEELQLYAIRLSEKECSPLLKDCCRKIGWEFGSALLSSDKIQSVCDIVRSYHNK